MKKITITVSETGEVACQFEGFRNDAEMIGTMLHAYTGTARSFMSMHAQKCSDEKCHFVRMNTAIVADLERIASLHLSEQNQSQPMKSA